VNEVPGIYVIPPAPRFVRMDIGVVLWPSFLAACLASLLFFAAVDPLLLRDAGPAVFRHIDRESGYALGFLFFWLMSSLASGLSLLLMRTPRAGKPAAPPAGAV
jgi:hypothetical protein